MIRALGCLLLVSSAAGAQAQAQAQGQGYTERLEDWALTSHNVTREPSPDGKRVEAIFITTQDIVAPWDPYPQVVNWVHARTREEVIRREVLLRPGDLYSAEKVAETERILRRMGGETAIFAIARIVPVKGSTPDAVSLLVYTKDLWSIRINATFSFVGPLVKQLRIKPTEQNFLGRNKQPSLDFDLRQATLALGEAYVDPRLWGSQLSLGQSAAIILNHQTGRVEGSRGGLSVGRPLRSLDDKWGMSVGGDWGVGRERLFEGPTLLLLDYPDEQNPTAAIPFLYDSRSVNVNATLTRSFGRQYKTNLFWTLGGSSTKFEPPAESGLTPEQRAWFIDEYLPYSETMTYLVSGVETFEARYRVLRNVDTFMLPEDYQVGYSAQFDVRLAPRLLAEATNHIAATAAARYRFDWGENLFSVAARAAVRFVPEARGAGTDGNWVNQSVSLELYEITPRVGIGRFVARAMADVRWNDLRNRLVLLGGAFGLRGARDGLLRGHNYAVGTLEYRTLPVELFTAQLGAVLFWDTASAFERNPQFTHSVGMGLRLLIPQFNVDVIRIDFGWVVNGPRPDLVNRFSGSMGQAIGPSL